MLMFRRRPGIGIPVENHVPTPQELINQAEISFRLFVAESIGQIAFSGTEDISQRRAIINTAYKTPIQDGKSKLESLLSREAPSEDLVRLARISLMAGSRSSDAISVLRAAGVSETDITSILYGQDTTELIRRANPQPLRPPTSRPRSPHRDSQGRTERQPNHPSRQL